MWYNYSTQSIAADSFELSQLELAGRDDYDDRRHDDRRGRDALITSANTWVLTHAHAMKRYDKTWCLQGDRRHDDRRHDDRRHDDRRRHERRAPSPEAWILMLMNGYQISININGMIVDSQKMVPKLANMVSNGCFFPRKKWFGRGVETKTGPCWALRWRWAVFCLMTRGWNHYEPSKFTIFVLNNSRFFERYQMLMAQTRWTK